MQAAIQNYGAPTTLAVVRFGPVWKVWIGQRWVGLFNQQNEAVLYAVQAADALERQGRRANVLIQQPFGELSNLQLPSPAAAGKPPVRAGAADRDGRELRLVSVQTLARTREPAPAPS